MTTIRQYIAKLRDTQQQVGLRMGCNLNSMPKDLRVAVLPVEFRPVPYWQVNGAGDQHHGELSP